MIPTEHPADDSSPQTGPEVAPVIPMDDMPAGPAVPARRRRVIVVAALVAVGVLSIAGTAVALTPREDSGIVACRRIDEFSKTFAAGGRPTITEDEGRELTDLLSGSDHEVLAQLGEVFQYGYESGEDEQPEGVMGAVMFATAVYSPCMKLGLPMTRPIPQR